MIDITGDGWESEEDLYCALIKAADRREPILIKDALYTPISWSVYRGKGRICDCDSVAAMYSEGYDNGFAACMDTKLELFKEGKIAVGMEEILYDCE